MIRKIGTIANKNLSIRSSVIINLLLLSAMLLIDITPYLERNLHPIFQIVIFVLWFISSRGLPVKFGSTYPKEIIKWWSIYSIWVILMCLIRHSNISPTHYIATLYFYFIPYMMVVVFKSYNLREMELLWKIFFVIFIINLLQNYFIGINNPDVFRLRESFAKTANFTTNAGGTVFVAASIFIAPVLWTIRQNSLNRKMKGAMLLGIALIFIYVSVINNRATASIVLLLEMVVLLLLRFIVRKGKSLVAIVWLILTLSTIAFLFSGTILQTAIDIFGGNERFLKRLTDIMMVSEGVSLEDIEEGSLAARYLLWLTSINTFFSSIPHFLFGVGIDEHEGDIMSLIKYGVGCHSEFFDLGAKFGIIGVFLIYKFLKETISFTLGLTNSEKQKSIVMVFWGGFVFYSFVNLTFAAPVFYVLFIFLPFSLVLVNNKRI